MEDVIGGQFKGSAQSSPTFFLGPAILFVRNAAEHTLLAVIGQKPQDGLLGIGGAQCPKVHQPKLVVHEVV